MKKGGSHLEEIKVLERDILNHDKIEYFAPGRFDKLSYVKNKTKKLKNNKLS
jgi:hypothetical protein